MYKRYTLFAVLTLFVLCCVLYKYYTDITVTTPKSYVNNEYVLKEENEIVSLYHNGKYVRSYDIDTSALPKIDRDNLKSGIKLKDMASVNSLIEDFDGI